MRTVFQMDAVEDEFNVETFEVVDSSEIASPSSGFTPPEAPKAGSRKGGRIPTAMPDNIATAVSALSPVSPTSPSDNEGARFESIEETDTKRKELQKFDLSKIDLRKIELKKKLPRIPVGQSLAIDLMPQSYKDTVELRQTKKKWIGYSVVALVVSLIIPAFAFIVGQQIAGQISAEQDKHAVLDLQIAKHAEINQALESAGEARRLLEKSAGMEVDWNKLMGTIEGSLPEGTRITAISVVSGGKDTRTAQEKEDNPSDRPTSSVVLLSLASNDTFGYSDTLKALEGINIVDEVTISGLSITNGQYLYSAAFPVDISILTERFGLEG